MYAFRPAEAGPPAGAGPLHLRRVARRDFTGRPGAAAPGADELAFLDEYLSDLARPYGSPLRAEVLADGGAHRYEEMAEELIAALVPPTDPVDVVVLAFAVPDVRAGRTVATYRGHACPGDPLAFAVCDQGGAAPFAALRLVGELTRTGGCRRGLLLVVEQPALAYQPAGPVVLPARPAAVGLLFGPAGPARLVAHRQHPGIPADMLPARLAAELADLRADAGETTLVLGGGLAGTPVDALPVDRVRVAPAGQPGTGVWWGLADELAEAGADPDPVAGPGTVPAPALDPVRRRLVLADHDTMLGYLCLAAFDVGRP
ncbi:2-hydroxy-acid oxidase [Plantactinospora sp. WMMB334]|uniref:2-hydroxy-acid oxidase n=1 Tax=Plantactinospora sp. WMMB334 TaxID=3404119 RepID=UPI003B950A7B